MRSLRARFAREERGQALVEFAITLPVLILLLLGIVDFARAWNAYEVLTDAGREGTRQAVVDDASTTEAAVRTTIKDAAGRAGLVVTDADIAINQFRTGRGDPTTITITYGYTLNWVGWMIGLVGGDRVLNFTIISTMRQE